MVPQLSVRYTLVVAAALTAPAAAVDDVASVDDNMNRVFTNHPASPSMLFINEAVGSSRVSTLPGKNKLYELLLYPAKKVTTPLKAVVTLSGDIAGTLYLTQQKPPLGAVALDGFVQDTETELRVVFDKFGDLNAGCDIATSQTFNPYGISHGRYEDPSRDLGDLGRVSVSSNHFALEDRSISLTGSRSVLGRKLVVQDAEGRAGCGLVGYAAQTGKDP